MRKKGHLSPPPPPPLRGALHYALYVRRPHSSFRVDTLIPRS